MKRKTVAVLLLLAVITFLFCGCAESFTYTFYLDKSNAVHKEYRLTYNADAEDAAVVKAEAERAFGEVVKRYDWSEFSEVDSSTAGVVELRVVFPSVTDYYIALGYTGQEENEPSKKTWEGVRVAYEKSDKNYYSDEVMAFARSILGEGYEEVDLTGIDYYYVYGTRSSQTLTNADSYEYKDGIYYHTWKLVPGAESEILVVNYGLNGILLYVLIISVFVLSLAVIFVIIYVTDKKNKQKIRSFSEPHSEEMSAPKDE